MQTQLTVCLWPHWVPSTVKIVQSKITVAKMPQDYSNEPFVSAGTHNLSCNRNPLMANVTHDLSQPFFITASVVLLFSTPSVAVGGVALRTSCHFSTFALTGCASEGGLSHNYLLNTHTHTHTHPHSHKHAAYLHTQGTFFVLFLFLVSKITFVCWHLLHLFHSNTHWEWSVIRPLTHFLDLLLLQSCEGGGRGVYPSCPCLAKAGHTPTAGSHRGTTISTRALTYSKFRVPSLRHVHFVGLREKLGVPVEHQRTHRGDVQCPQAWDWTCDILVGRQQY